MARNPKQDANLKPPFDSNQNREEASKNGKKGGKKALPECVIARVFKPEFEMVHRGIIALISEVVKKGLKAPWLVVYFEAVLDDSCGAIPTATPGATV